MKKFSITTPIAYGVIAIGFFLSTIIPHWLFTPALVLIGLMALLVIWMLWCWPKNQSFAQAYVEHMVKIPPRRCVLKLISAQAGFWLMSAWLFWMLAWLMSQSGRLQVSAPALTQAAIIEHYWLWVVAPFVFILAVTLAKIYLAYVRQLVPQPAEFLFPNAKQQPKLFFHNVLVGVEGYGKVLGLSFCLAACILIFVNGFTQMSFVPDYIDWPLQNGLFSLIVFIALIKVMRHLAGFLQRKVRRLGPMLVGITVITAFVSLFCHALGLMVTYPQLLYFHTQSPTLMSLSETLLNIRFEFFWLAWCVSWSEELSQYLTRLCYGYDFKALLIGVVLSVGVLAGCFYLALHAPLAFLLQPLVQITSVVVVLAAVIAWFWTRDCAVKMRYGALPTIGKNRTLVMFIRRFLPLMPLLVSSYLIFGWMAPQFFIGAVCVYWVPMMVSYTLKAAMMLWVEVPSRKRNEITIS